VDNSADVTLAGRSLQVLAATTGKVQLMQWQSRQLPKARHRAEARNFSVKNVLLKHFLHSFINS